MKVKIYILNYELIQEIQVEVKISNGLLIMATVI